MNIFFGDNATSSVCVYHFHSTLVSTEYLTAFIHKQECLYQDNVDSSDDKSSLGVSGKNLIVPRLENVPVLFHTQLRSTMTFSSI